MTKRFPKMECKREFRIGCFKYKGRDRVTGIKFLPTSASELWQALNIPKSQSDLVMLKLNIHTARFMVNWAFPLTDCEDREANQLKSPVQAPGTVGLQSPCILRRAHTHTHTQTSINQWDCSSEKSDKKIYTYRSIQIGREDWQTKLSMWRWQKELANWISHFSCSGKFHKIIKKYSPLSAFKTIYLQTQREHF